MGNSKSLLLFKYNWMRDESCRKNMVIMIQLRFQLRKVDARSMFRNMAIKFVAYGSPYLMVMSSFKDL